MKQLDHLFQKYEGREAWIVGAGPSLDLVDFSGHGKEPVSCPPDALIIAINWTVDLFRSAPADDVIWIATDRREILRFNRLPAASFFVMPEDSVVDARMMKTLYSAEELDARFVGFKPAELLHEPCTVAAAADLCRWLGVKSVVFAGVDGTAGYAKRLGEPYASRVAKPTDETFFSAARRTAINCLTFVGIPWRDAVIKEEVETNG